MTQPEPTAPAVPGPLRTCIATGEEGTPERMIRFVVGPQGDVVVDGAEGAGLGKLQASGLPIARLGDAAALGGIFGREQTVYAAVARDDAGGKFIERIEVGAARWRGYRLNSTG